MAGGQQWIYLAVTVGLGPMTLRAPRSTAGALLDRLYGGRDVTIDWPWDDASYLSP